MRKLIWIVYIFFSMVNILAQQNNFTSIQFTSTEYNYNEIKEDGGLVNCSFEFLNSGSSLLFIKEISTSCGCTSPSWSKQPITSGKKGFVKIQFDPKEHYGSFKETVIVQSNAKDSLITLTIKGIVVPGNKRDTLTIKVGDLSVKATHINFGYIYKGKTESKKLEIANYTKKPMHIELTNLPPYVDALIYPSTIKPGGYGGIVIYYYPDKTDNWDYVIDRLGVLINGKKDSRAKLAITATIREDFSKMTPELLAMAPSAVFQSDTQYLGMISNKKDLTCKFLLYNRGNSDLIIHAVKPSCGCAVIKNEKDTIVPGDSTYLETTLNTKGLKGDFNRSITVITNDPKEYKQILWLVGNVKK